MEQIQDALSITRVEEQDVPVVTKVINSAYEGEPGKSWTSESHLVAGQRTTEELLRGIIRQPSVTLFKCSDAQSNILGCVLLEKKESTLYLGMLSVSPQAQAAGIGKQLLQFSEAYARENGFTSITITVINLRHELIDWYRRKGFAPTGNTETFSNKSSAPRTDFFFMEMKKELL